MSSVTDLQNRAAEIKQQYSALNEKNGHKQWGLTDYTSGLVGDVGDLVKLVMAKEGLRDNTDIDKKLAHELSDVLWCVFVLSEKLNINIEEEFLKTMDELEARIARS